MPEDELHSQHVPHAIVECLHRDFSFFHQFAQRQNEIFRRREIRLHIQTCFDRLAHRIFHVRRDAMFVVEIFDRRAVGDDIAREIRNRFAAAQSANIDFP